MLVQRLASGDDVPVLGSRPATRDATRIQDARERAARSAQARSVPPRPAHADAPKRLVLGAITIAVHDHDAHADRTSGVAAGRVRLFLVRGGSVQVPSRDGHVEVGDGQGILVTGPTSVRISSSGAGEVIAVGMPVDAFPELALPRNSAMLVEDAVLLRPISAFVSTLHAGGALDVHSRDRFAQILRDMILVALRRAVDRAGVAAAPSLHQRATSIIRRRYAEASLSAADVAAEMNVSLRQLERGFRPSGRTIRQELRRIRVAAAAALLREDPSAVRTVDAIATQVGLSNGSSLARAISAEGLPSPTRLRGAEHMRVGTSGGIHT